jgi:hypothetical protein
MAQSRVKVLDRLRSNNKMTCVLQVDYHRVLPYESSVFPHGQTTVSH